MNEFPRRSDNSFGNMSRTTTRNCASSVKAAVTGSSSTAALRRRLRVLSGYESHARSYVRDGSVTYEGQNVEVRKVCMLPILQTKFIPHQRIYVKQGVCFLNHLRPTPHVRTCDTILQQLWLWDYHRLISLKFFDFFV